MRTVCETAAASLSGTAARVARAGRFIAKNAAEIIRKVWMCRVSMGTPYFYRIDSCFDAWFTATRALLACSAREPD
jgi:hypothetical protein